jgi:hypothetical protein
MIGTRNDNVKEMILAMFIVVCFPPDYLTWSSTIGAFLREWSLCFSPISMSASVPGETTNGIGHPVRMDIDLKAGQRVDFHDGMDVTIAG